MSASSTVFRFFRLLLFIYLISLLIICTSATEIQRMTKRRQRPTFLFDAWGKRGASEALSPSLIGEVGESLIVAIPKSISKYFVSGDMAEEVNTPLELPQMSSKRGAYLDLPWG